MLFRLQGRRLASSMLFVCIVLYRLKAFWPHKEGNYFLFKFYNFYEYSPTFMVWTFRAKTTQIRISSMVIMVLVLLHSLVKFRWYYIIFYFTYTKYILSTVQSISNSLALLCFITQGIEWKAWKQLRTFNIWPYFILA